MKEKIRKIGVFEDFELNNFKLIKIPNPFIDSFTILNEEKEKSLKECVDILKRIYEEVKNEMNLDKREIEIRNKIDSLLYEYGGEKRGYPTRVISGNRVSNPNSITEGDKISYPIILDYGVLKKNIGAGVSRTFIQDDYKDFLNKAIELETELIDYIKPGRICSKIYEHYISTAKKLGLSELIHPPVSKPLLPYSKGVYIYKGYDLVIQPGSYFHINIEIYKPPDLGIKIIDVIKVKDKAVNITDFN